MPTRFELPGQPCQDLRYYKDVKTFPFDQNRVSEVCRKHHIRRLAVFGSVMRDDFAPSSDIDVLAEFESGHVPGLKFFTIEEQLGRVMGRKVDLNTPQFLSPLFRDRVIQESQILYDAA